MGLINSLLTRRSRASRPPLSAGGFADDGTTAPRRPKPGPAPPKEAPQKIVAAVATESADSLRDAGQYEQAAAAYQALVAVAPERNDLRVQLGNMLKDSGRLEEAEATYRTALAQSPDNADIYLQLGRALKLRGRLSDAAQSYRRAAELLPLAPEAARELRLIEAELLPASLTGPFAERVWSCYADFDYFERLGLLLPETYLDRTVLDWEAGDCAWSVCFLLKGARNVVAIDSYATPDTALDVLRQDSRFTFVSATAEDFLARDGVGNRFDFIFANAVTEHIQDLVSAFSALRSLLKPDGWFFTNHDNYYSPCGSHDHGFWFFGGNNTVTFQGAECWKEASKCAASLLHRNSLMQNFAWSWNELNARLTPSDCSICPYYKRSQPWAHLLSAGEFLDVFSSSVFLTGRPGAALNKITPFQLKQFLTEAGFHIVSTHRSYVENIPPRELIDTGIAEVDLKTTFIRVLSKIKESARS